MILHKNFEQAKQKEKIECRCDYCGKTFYRMKHNITRSHKYIQKDSCSNKICVQKKRIESNQKQFGTDNPFQNEKIKEKIQQTNLERYGTINPFQNEEIKEKQKATCQERYGVDNVFQNEDIKNKIKKKFQNSHGVDNAFQIKSIREKQQAALKNLYGVKHALQSDELRQKAMNTCIHNFGTFPANGVYGKTQQDIQDWLNSFGFNFKSTRSLIPGEEIDLYDANTNLAIEYCGLHWHHEFSPEPRDRKYHYIKYKRCLDQDVHLLTIFSDEWETRKEQCQSHIKSLLGIHDSRVYARKCSIKQIDKTQGKEFFEKYHIQGKNTLGIIFFGLFYQKELIAVMSLGRHNRQVAGIVLDRLCFKGGVQISGGASKLFAKCLTWASENNYKKIISFSDNRWSIGGVYKAMNFQLEKELNPDYSYVNIKSPNIRISKQSQKKSNSGCPEGMTETQWAHQNGLARIWDCGKKRWIFSLH